MAILNWLFFVPPVPERPEVNEIIKIFVLYSYDRTKTDSYLYYKIAIINLIVQIFFSICFWIYIFVLDQAASIDTFLYGYPLSVFPITITLTIFYALALFQARSPWPPLGPRMPVEPTQDQPPEEPFRLLGAAAFTVVVLLMIFSIPEYIRSYDLYNYVHDFRENTAANMAIFNVVYLVFYQVLITGGIAWGLINFFRRIKIERN